MDKFKTYGAHALAYLVSGLTIASKLDPSLLPPDIGVWVGVAGLVLTAGHNVVVASGVKPGDVVSVVKSFAMFAVAVMFAVTLAGSLAACQTAPTATQQSVAVVAVNIAAGQAIQRQDHDPAVWKARAVQYKAIAVQLQGVNDAGNATIATLAADLQPLVDKLPPADQLAANSLIAAVTPFLQDKVNSSETVAHTREAVAVLLSAVVKACEAYGA